MFSYSPIEANESGRILAGGIVGSASTKADTMKQLGSDIGGALQSIGGMYGAINEKNAMGDSAYEALGAISQMYPGMKGTFGALGKLDDRTRRLASMSILDNLGAVSQLGIAGMNAQVRQAAPAAKAQYGAASQVAAGQGRVTAPPSNINFDAIP